MIASDLRASASLVIAGLMAHGETFIDRHGLWNDEQRRLVADIKRRVESESKV